MNNSKIFHLDMSKFNFEHPKTASWKAKQRDTMNDLDAHVPSDDYNQAKFRDVSLKEKSDD